VLWCDTIREPLEGFHRHPCEIGIDGLFLILRRSCRDVKTALVSAMTLDISIVTASNDEACLQLNLMASPMVKDGTVTVHVERNAPSATIAYNRGLDATRSDIIIFAHQDVYFPQGWEEKLAESLQQLETFDPKWAVLACCGIHRNEEFVGDVWSTGLGGRIGAPVSEPQPVQSVDELFIILRRSAGLRWDNDLPNFHLYGSDIVQTALAAGHGAWVMNLPVIHNDKFHVKLGDDFTRSYRWMQRKWRACLPIRATVGQVTRWGIALRRAKWEAYRSLEERRGWAKDPQTAPHIYATECGLEEDRISIPGT
jgi:glycosyltransferase involved in cell wall biosynthesis